MNKVVKLSGAIVLSGLLLAGCGGQKAAATPSVKAPLASYTKQVKALYLTSKYELPAKNLSAKMITKADDAEKKVFKLHSSFTKAQKKTYTATQSQLKAAKTIFATQQAIKDALDKNQVIKDESFKPATLDHDFASLQKDKPIFAKTIADKVSLIDKEVKAVGLVKNALTGTADKEKIDAARKAIADVSVKAFRDKYLPKLDEVINKLPKDQQDAEKKEQATAVAASKAAPEGSNVTPEVQKAAAQQVATAIAPASQQAAGGQSNGNSTPQYNGGGNTPNNSNGGGQQTNNGGNSGSTDGGQTSGNGGGGTSTPSQPAQKPSQPMQPTQPSKPAEPVHAVDPVGSGGLFPTFAAASAAADAWTDKQSLISGAANARVFSVYMSDGSMQWSWEPANF